MNRDRQPQGWTHEPKAHPGRTVVRRLSPPNFGSDRQGSDMPRQREFDGNAIAYLELSICCDEHSANAKVFRRRRERFIAGLQVDTYFDSERAPVG